MIGGIISDLMDLKKIFYNYLTLNSDHNRLSHSFCINISNTFYDNIFHNCMCNWHYYFLSWIKNFTNMGSCDKYLTSTALGTIDGAQNFANFIGDGLVPLITGVTLDVINNNFLIVFVFRIKYIPFKNLKIYFTSSLS